MKIVQRPFSNENDKYQMVALACQFPADNLHVTDLPYRLSSWALDNPDNTCLWMDENHQLAAWAVLQTPFWEIDYVCHPQAETSLHQEILAWADQRARAALDSDYGRPCWFINVFSGQAKRIQGLESAGFKCQSDAGPNALEKVLLRRSNPAPVKVYKPPPGFTVRSLAGAGEVKAYVQLHRSTFETKNMTEQWRLRTIQHPAYTPELDIVVEAPDGRLGAFCICWFDEQSWDGRVEPLGCHKDFRRYALGRVALSTGLQRLQSIGAQHIFVETDKYRTTALGLYESFDFQLVQDVLVYRKDYGKL